MTDSELRKTVILPRMTMQEMVLGRTFQATDQNSDGKVLVSMDENEWANEQPTVEVPDQPFKELDPINPEHYKADGLEVIQIIEAFKLDYHRASALKYLLRAGRKDDELQDMRKCLWFVNRAIAKMEGK